MEGKLKSLAYILKNKGPVSHRDGETLSFCKLKGAERKLRAPGFPVLCWLLTFNYLLLWARFAHYKILRGAEKRLYGQQPENRWLGEPGGSENTSFCSHGYTGVVRKDTQCQRSPFDSAHGSIMSHDFLTRSCNCNFFSKFTYIEHLLVGFMMGVVVS